MTAPHRRLGVSAGVVKKGSGMDANGAVEPAARLRIAKGQELKLASLDECDSQNLVSSDIPALEQTSSSLRDFRSAYLFDRLRLCTGK